MSNGFLHIAQLALEGSIVNFFYFGRRLRRFNVADACHDASVPVERFGADIIKRLHHVAACL